MGHLGNCLGMPNYKGGKISIDSSCLLGTCGSVSPAVWRAAQNGSNYLVWNTTNKLQLYLFFLQVGENTQNIHKWLCTAVEKCALVDLSYSHTLVKVQCNSELCTWPVAIWYQWLCSWITHQHSWPNIKLPQAHLCKRWRRRQLPSQLSYTVVDKYILQVLQI
jgi:hypothetical protein